MMKTTTTAMTFTSKSKSRASEEFGAVDLTHIDTIHADGRVEWSVRGTSDGDYVNASGVRRFEGVVDFEKITACRIATGWFVTKGGK